MARLLQKVWFVVVNPGDVLPERLPGGAGLATRRADDPRVLDMPRLNVVPHVTPLNIFIQPGVFNEPCKKEF